MELAYIMSIEGVENEKKCARALQKVIKKKVVSSRSEEC